MDLGSLSCGYYQIKLLYCRSSPDAKPLGVVWTEDPCHVATIRLNLAIGQTVGSQKQVSILITPDR